MALQRVNFQVSFLLSFHQAEVLFLADHYEISVWQNPSEELVGNPVLRLVDFSFIYQLHHCVSSASQTGMQQCHLQCTKSLKQDLMDKSKGLLLL